MVSSILLRAKNNSAAFSKLQRFTGKRRQRIIHLFAAVPQLMRFGCRGIGQPDGPRLRPARNQWQMGLSPGRANKNQLLAVRRPAWRKVSIDAGGNVTHALLS